MLLTCFISFCAFREWIFLILGGKRERKSTHTTYCFVLTHRGIMLLTCFISFCAFRVSSPVFTSFNM